MSWTQLQTMIDENRENARQTATNPPVACPIDGEILDVREDGIRSCPWGNFRYP